MRITLLSQNKGLSSQVLCFEKNQRKILYGKVLKKKKERKPTAILLLNILIGISQAWLNMKQLENLHLVELDFFSSANFSSHFSNLI